MSKQYPPLPANDELALKEMLEERVKDNQNLLLQGKLELTPWQNENDNQNRLLQGKQNSTSLENKNNILDNKNDDETAFKPRGPGK